MDTLAFHVYHGSHGHPWDSWAPVECHALYITFGLQHLELKSSYSTKFYAFRWKSRASVGVEYHTKPGTPNYLRNVVVGIQPPVRNIVAYMELYSYYEDF
jgi:hypothetical protein